MASLGSKTATVKPRRFGQGILATHPTHRLPCTLADDAWWAAESAREEGREVERMYDAYRAQERLDAGLQPW